MIMIMIMIEERFFCFVHALDICHRAYAENAVTAPSLLASWHLSSDSGVGSETDPAVTGVGRVRLAKISKSRKRPVAVPHRVRG